MKTLLAVSLFLAIGGGAHAQARDTPPTTPGNPVARAYGPTSGGIAWQRSSDDKAVRGYEITRDGVALGVRDTLSYVASDLQPGNGYNFAIVAIDSAGQRSGRALARIETPDARPNVPTGFVANVYSATSAGIKWNRSVVFGERYEVKRDGQIVATATNGTSYVDKSLSSRRPYLFEVIAINRQGQRSTAARLFVRTADGSTPPPPVEPPPNDPFGTPDPSGATVIARLGYPGLPERLDDLVSASYLDLYLEINEEVSNLFTNPDGVKRVVNCPGGGTASGSSGGFGDVALMLDSCVIEERTLTGRLEHDENRFPTGAGAVRERRITFDAMSIDAGVNGTLTVTGSYERSEAEGRNDPCDGFRTATDTISIESARLQRDGNTSSITDASYTQSNQRQDRPLGRADASTCSTNQTLTFEGTATVVATRFGAQTATIATDGEIIGDTEDGESRTAVLEADFGDGSNVAVTATSAISDEVQVDIVSDGAAVSFTDEFAFEAYPYPITLF